MAKDSENPAYAEWQKRAGKEIRQENAEAALTQETPEGLKIKPLYTAADLEELPQTGLPGFAPFTRGVRATMYAGQPWTIRQYAGFSTAEESNAFYRAALRGGQTGLSVAFDLATHRGYDSDHPRVAGDVGKAGVAIDSVEDMKRLFDGIPLAEVSVSMTMNGAVLPVLAAYIVAAEEQGVPPEKLSGTIQNDILKEFMVRNTYIYPPAPSMRIVADIIAHTAERLPKFNSISISGYHMHEAGATTVQELTFTLLDGLEYARAACARGLKIDDFAPRLSFFFAIGMDFFMEIAKLRAARALWAKWIQAEFSPQSEKSLMLRTHCQTSGVSLTEQDPLNNVTRTAYEALAAVLGGTQSLHTNSYDEAIALPSDQAARIARNTQLILQKETGVTRVVDPLGGSYYVEHLTASLMQAAEEQRAEVEKRGGMTAAIAAGWPKLQIEAAATRRQARLDSGTDIIVGVNAFAPEEETKIDVRTIDNRAVRESQIARLKQLRTTRDNAKVEKALAALREGAKNGTTNLLALAIDCMRARTTLGEVSETLAQIFQRHEAVPEGVRGVYAEHLGDDPSAQAVRLSLADFTKARGRAPRIFIGKLGQDGHDRGAKVVAAAYGDLGFDVVIGPLFQTPEEAAQQARACGADIIGISSQAAGHLTLIPELMQALRSSGAPLPVIVGGVIPQQDYAALRRAGVAAIYGPGTRIPDTGLALLSLISGQKN